MYCGGWEEVWEGGGRVGCALGPLTGVIARGWDYLAFVFSLLVSRSRKTQGRAYERPGQNLLKSNSSPVSRKRSVDASPFLTTSTPTWKAYAPHYPGHRWLKQFKAQHAWTQHGQFGNLLSSKSQDVNPLANNHTPQKKHTLDDSIPPSPAPKKVSTFQTGTSHPKSRRLAAVPQTSKPLHKRILERTTSTRPRLLNNKPTGSHAWWKCVKELTKIATPKEPIPELHINNVKASSDEAKANLLASFFAAQCSNTNDGTLGCPFPLPADHPTFDFGLISDETVLTKLLKLPVYKSTGCVVITNRLLRNTTQHVAPSISNVSVQPIHWTQRVSPCICLEES